MPHLHRRSNRGRPRSRRAACPSRLLDLDLEALDERVGEQRLAHPTNLASGGLGVVAIELEVDDTTDAGGSHVEAELAKGMSDRLPLGIEDAALRAHSDRCFHRTTSGSWTYSANEIPVSRSNAST